MFGEEMLRASSEGEISKLIDILAAQQLDGAGVLGRIWGDTAPNSKSDVPLHEQMRTAMEKRDATASRPALNSSGIEGAPGASGLIVPLVGPSTQAEADRDMPLSGAPKLDAVARIVDLLSSGGLNAGDNSFWAASGLSVLSGTTAASTVTSAAKTGGGLGSAVSEIASSMITNAFGMAPVIRSIAGLFGGGPKQTVPPIPFSMPAAINLERSLNGGSGAISDLRHTSMGFAESITDGGYTQVSGPIWSETSPGSPYETGDTADSSVRSVGRLTTAKNAPSAPTINIQVSAMDSRLFLDHSSQIAQAVREAMLNMHSLNDFVSEL